VLERVKARSSPYVDMSKLFRELAGLVDTGLLTDEDRAIIRGGDKPGTGELSKAASKS
jgi:hypothetical protein